MPALSEQEKQAIVVLLAQFHRPVDVVVHMREHFGIEVDRFQVRSYDPTNPRYGAGAKWRSIFDAARAEHVTAVSSIPIANKAYRLNMLQKLLDRANAMGNIPLACAILRQAAQEMKSYVAEGKDAALNPADEGPYRVDEMSPEERRSLLRDMLSETVKQLNRDKAAQVAEKPVAITMAA